MDVCTRISDDVERRRKQSGMSLKVLLKLYGINKSTFYNWSHCLWLQASKTNVRKPTEDEIKAVREFRKYHPQVGYRSLAWMMNDAGVASLTESAVYRILIEFDALSDYNQNNLMGASKEYQNKPRYVHHHWHTDIAYIKVRGIFYFLIVMLDGYSRYILDWELMPDMLGSSVEDFIQRVKDKYPAAKPILITDNGSQFISRDFKKLVSNLDIQLVHTRRNHPQSNGKIERLNRSIKQEAIRPAFPTSFQEAYGILAEYVDFYNNQRLHAGIKYLRPADMFLGRDQQVLQRRKDNLERAREARILANKLRLNRSLIS